MRVHKTVGVAKNPVLSKHLNVIAQPLPLREAIDGVEAITSYETFKQGGNRLTIGLQNCTRENIILRKGTKVARVAVARVAVANVVPPMLALRLSTNENKLKYMTQEHKKAVYLRMLMRTKINQNQHQIDLISCFQSWILQASKSGLMTYNNRFIT